MPIPILLVLATIIILDKVSGFHNRYPVIKTNRQLDCKLNDHLMRKPHMTTSRQDNNMPKQKTKMDAGLLVGLGIASPAFLFPEMAHAVDGKYGWLESIPAGMIHPIIMLALYGLTFLAGYHGLQFRRIRDLGYEIKQLQSAGETAPNIIADLQKERSKLMSGGHKDKHSILGAVLLGLGVVISLEGGLSTYWRVGELFPGEHLFAGAAMTFIWAAAAALIPWMSRGEDWARNLHIGLNVIGLGLFTWQVFSGWEIMVNVFNGVSGW